MKNTIIIAIVVALVAAGGGFFGGMQYQKGKQPAIPGFADRGNFNASALRQRFGNGAGGGSVRGTIASISGNTMTVTEANGSSKIVLLSSSTTVDKTVTGATSDLTTGATVMAVGTANSDGSVTATTVSLNPAAGFGGAGGAPGAPGMQVQ